MTVPSEFSLIIEGKTYILRSSLSSPRYSAEKFSLALAKLLPQWGEEAPVIKFLLSEEVVLFIFLVDMENDVTTSVTLLDAVNITNVNITLDPRKLPARIGGRCYSASVSRYVDTVLLLCIFERLSEEDDLSDGEYTLWGAMKVQVEVLRQVYKKGDGSLGSDELVMVTDIVGPPVSYETDVWL